MAKEISVIEKEGMWAILEKLRQLGATNHSALSEPIRIFADSVRHVVEVRAMPGCPNLAVLSEALNKKVESIVSAEPDFRQAGLRKHLVAMVNLARHEMEDPRKDACASLAKARKDRTTAQRFVDQFITAATPVAAAGNAGVGV